MTDKRPLLLALLFPLAVTAGCPVDQTGCRTDGDCPSGEVCRSIVCVEEQPNPRPDSGPPPVEEDAGPPLPEDGGPGETDAGPVDAGETTDAGDPTDAGTDAGGSDDAGPTDSGATDDGGNADGG